jgi:ABC-2 type transport system permease protein
VREELTLTLVHSLAFYIGNVEGAAFQYFNAILAFSTYPTDIFRGMGRVVLFTLIPAGFISYMPLGLMKQFQLHFVVGAVGMALGVYVLGCWCFYRGLARYSSGNRMGMKG